MKTMNNDDDTKGNKTPEVMEQHAAEPDEKEKAKMSEKASASPTAHAPLRRGFALMDRAKVREIARRGGLAAHERGTAHEFSREEAKEAGRKGGRAPHRSRGKRRAPAAAATAPAATNGATNGAPQTPST